MIKYKCNKNINFLAFVGIKVNKRFRCFFSVKAEKLIMPFLTLSFQISPKCRMAIKIFK